MWILGLDFRGSGGLTSEISVILVIFSNYNGIVLVPAPSLWWKSSGYYVSSGPFELSTEQKDWNTLFRWEIFWSFQNGVPYILWAVAWNWIGLERFMEQRKNFWATFITFLLKDIKNMKERKKHAKLLGPYRHSSVQ